MSHGTQWVSHYVDNRHVRLTDGHAKSSKSLRTVPQEPYQRRICDDAVLSLCASLCKQGECGCSHESHSVIFAGRWRSSCPINYRQAVRQNEDILGQKAQTSPQSTSPIGAFLILVVRQVTLLQKVRDEIV